MKKKLNGIQTFDVVIYILVTLAVLTWILPFLYLIAVSFSSPEAILNRQVTVYPVDFNFNAYDTIFHYPDFFNAYKNTFIYTILGTSVAMLMTILFAYPLSKPYIKGQKVIMKFVIFSMFFSGGLIPTYLLISNLGMVGTIWAMIIPFAINQFNLIIMINFFKTIPKELEEAALIDGLGYWGILRSIVVPLAKPAVATITLYYAVYFWNDWFNGLIYMNSHQYPVMLLLRNIVNGTAAMGETAGSADKTTIEISIKSAVIITSTLPIMIIYPFLQKYFEKGMTLGAVKE